MHDSKFQVFLFLGFIFFRTFFPGILFPETLLTAPIMLGKKVPGIQNPWLYFQWHFFQGLDKIRTFFQKFWFPGFFSRNFLSRTFWHRFIYWEHIALKGRQNVCIFWSGRSFFTFWRSVNKNYFQQASNWNCTDPEKDSYQLG